MSLNPADENFDFEGWKKAQDEFWKTQDEAVDRQVKINIEFANMMAAHQRQNFRLMIGGLVVLLILLLVTR